MTTFSIASTPSFQATNFAVEGMLRKSGVEGTSLAALLAALSFPDFTEENPKQFFEIRRIKAGKTVCLSQNNSSELYAVQVGILKTEFIDPICGKYAVCFPRTGDLVGCELLTSADVCAATTAVTDVTLIVIPLASARALMRGCDAFSDVLYGILGKYILDTHKRLRSQTRLTAAGRVAAFLIAEMERSKSYATRKSIVLRMKRCDIASYLGIRQETFSRILNDFEVDGLILRCKRIVKIYNANALKSKINGNSFFEQVELNSRIL